MAAISTGDTLGGRRAYGGKNQNLEPKSLDLNPSSATYSQYDFGQAI